MGSLRHRFPSHVHTTVGAAGQEGSIHPHLLDSGAPWLGPNTLMGPSAAPGRLRPGVLGYCTPTDAEGDRSTDSFRAGVGMSPSAEHLPLPLEVRPPPCSATPHPSFPAPELPSISNLLAQRLGAAGPGAPPHLTKAQLLRPDGRAFSLCYGATSNLPPSPICQMGSNQALEDRERRTPSAHGDGRPSCLRSVPPLRAAVHTG